METHLLTKVSRIVLLAVTGPNCFVNVVSLCERTPLTHLNLKKRLFIEDICIFKNVLHKNNIFVFKRIADSGKTLGEECRSD